MRFVHFADRQPPFSWIHLAASWCRDEEEGVWGDMCVGVFLFVYLFTLEFKQYEKLFLCFWLELWQKLPVSISLLSVCCVAVLRVHVCTACV